MQAVIRDTILATSVGNLVTEDTTLPMVWSLDFRHSGSDGWAIDFDDLLENFYLLYQTPETILLEMFYM